jgi:zinc transporter ZupT
MMIDPLVSETIVTTFAIAALCVLPAASQRIRAHSGIFVLTGTGAMLGICLFDLLPDVFEMGGVKGIVLTVFVFAFYSVMHVFHLDQHHQQKYEDAVVTPSPFFFVSIIGHCFASGMLLTVSRNFSESLSVNVYLALLIHKGYEALTVSSILIGSNQSRLLSSAILGTYILSFPLGVALAALLGASNGQNVALVISGVAVGTLLGCLVFDFLIPSFFQLKQRRTHIGWITLGLLITQLIMKSIAHHAG